MEETFATRLKKILKIRNIKPVELAEKSGIPKSAISQYLSGMYEAKQKNIDKLSKALNVNEAWLMGHDVPMKKNNVSDINYRLFEFLDIEGLDEDDLRELQQFIEFKKNLKKNNK